jgi:hypothetical protein
MGHSKAPEPSTRLLTRPLPRRTLHYPRPHGHLPCPLGTARGGQEQRLLPGRGRLHARAGEAMGPSLRRGALEHADGRAGAAHAWQRNGVQKSGQQGKCGGWSGTLQRSVISKTLVHLNKSRLSWLAAGPVGWRPRSKARTGACVVRCFVLITRKDVLECCLTRRFTCFHHPGTGGRASPGVHLCGLDVGLLPVVRFIVV